MIMYNYFDEALGEPFVKSFLQLTNIQRKDFVASKKMRTYTFYMKLFVCVHVNQVLHKGNILIVEAKHSLKVDVFNTISVRNVILHQAHRNLN